MTATLAALALILVAAMLVWLVRDLTRSLRMPRWPISPKDEDH